MSVIIADVRRLFTAARIANTFRPSNPTQQQNKLSLDIYEAIRALERLALNIDVSKVELFQSTADPLCVGLRGPFYNERPVGIYTDRDVYPLSAAYWLFAGLCAWSKHASDKFRPVTSIQVGGSRGHDRTIVTVWLVRNLNPTQSMPSCCQPNMTHSWRGCRKQSLSLSSGYRLEHTGSLARRARMVFHR